LLFSQSINELCQLWSNSSRKQNDDDDVYYSAIVHSNQNYQIKEDVYLSLPVRFKNNGTFEYVKAYKVNDKTQSIIEEIIRV
jgi:hypothetical protein